MLQKIRMRRKKGFVKLYIKPVKIFVLSIVRSQFPPDFIHLSSCDQIENRFPEVFHIGDIFRYKFIYIYKITVPVIDLLL